MRRANIMKTRFLIIFMSIMDNTKCYRIVVHKEIVCVLKDYYKIQFTDENYKLEYNTLNVIKIKYNVQNINLLKQTDMTVLPV